MWHVNRRAIDPSRTIGLHAGAVARDGGAILLVGASNAGKTTLTTGLVRTGAGYLTDELVTLDDDGLVRPYPKPLAIGEGSHRLFPELRPAWSGAPETRPQRVWLVPAGDVGAAGASGPATPRAIVLVQHQGADRTELTRIPPAAAATTLLEHVIERGPSIEVLDWVADLAERAPAYRLLAADLDRSCRLVLEVADS